MEETLENFAVLALPYYDDVTGKREARNVPESVFADLAALRDRKFLGGRLVRDVLEVEAFFVGKLIFGCASVEWLRTLLFIPKLLSRAFGLWGRS